MLLDAWKELDFDLQLYLLICNHCSYIACGITIGISKVFHVLNGLRRIISVSVLNWLRQVRSNPSALFISAL